MDLLEQLPLLSDKIEKMSVLLEDAASLFFESDEENEVASYEQMDARLHASLLLRATRIHLCLEPIKKGDASCAAYFCEDWEEIIACLRFEYMEVSKNELLADAVDIILLLDPTKRKDLLRLLDFPTRLKIRKRKPLRQTVVNSALKMADYCLKAGLPDELYRIISHLISLSEKRNAAKLDDHRAVVAEALRYTVDNDRELTSRLCDSQQRYFDGVVDTNACHFYWLYGFSLFALDREDAAIPILKRCYDLCMAVEGENSWLGMRAAALYATFQLNKGDAVAAEPYLWDTLKKIDSNFYTGMDETAASVAASTRATLLKFRMERQCLRGLLPEIARLRDYCISVGDTTTSPFLTVRFAENLLSGYYLETGDYLQAADHALNALHSVSPNNLSPQPSDILIYTNLLLIYASLNDVGQTSYYVDKLTDLLDEFEDDTFITSRVLLIINTALKKFQTDPTDLEDDRKALKEFYQSICDSELEPAKTATENLTYAHYILDLCSGILDSRTASHEELLCFREIVSYFKNRPDIYPFNDTQKASYYTLLAQIEWQLDSPKALDYLAVCLHYVDSISPSREVSISIFRFAAIVYYYFHRMDEALSVVDRVLSGITSAWQKATAYLNDHRVCELLTFIQLYFNVCCAIMRTAVKPEVMYERILQFKNLPALVGRERNKLLRMAPVDEELKARIFALQNQLASAEWNDSLQGTSTAQTVAAELERKEAEFAAQFPQIHSFTEITFPRVCDKLPENSAILEYYFVVDPSMLTNKPHDTDNWNLDIFITYKRKNSPHLEHIEIQDGNTIQKQARELIDILQNPDDVSSSGKKASLRGELYRSLIAPVLPFLEGITHLYIAPDDQLCNLPFEILYAGKSGFLQDHFKICRLTCGRDLLFYDDQEATGGSSFILGDPNYDSERGERTDSPVRGGQLHLEPVSALPFSGIEAKRIGRRCHCGVFFGDAATKYALQNALPCRIIHLATHGVFDDELETDSLYASHLVFAGYNKWVSSKTESSFCGNGILTADEISRMDLKNTELVVLSACQTGLGDTSYGSVRGFLSAFSAAGARWVVSHMWDANDFTTPILMDAFYDAYLGMGKDVPDALQYAKNYLRTVTMRELRGNGWFDLPADTRFSKEIRQAIVDMRDNTNDWPDAMQPFADEYYWGGFTVHKAR